MFGRKKKISKKDIEPDEIFMDSVNLAGFERELFEGRMEAPLSEKVSYAVFLVFLAGIVIALFQLVNLQVFNHGDYLARAENNTLVRTRIEAERGLIYDRNMTEIAWNSSEGRAYWAEGGLSHILGHVGYPEELSADVSPKSRVGRVGVEAAFNEVLRGKDGSRLIEENVDGSVLSQAVELQPVDGGGVVLTIDARMQSALFSILKKVAQDRGFHAASAVVIGVETGDILTAVSFPEFSSGILSRGEPSGVIASYFEDDARPFFFRAFEGLYAPGSVFKPIVALAALTEDIISPSKEILSTGSISIPNPYFPDLKSVFYDWKAHGLVDMRRALAVSSNVYFYTIGGGFGDQRGLGVEKIVEYAKKAGLGKKVGVELPEAEGFLPTPEWKERNDEADPAWRIGDTYNLSIGQGSLQATPLQMASVASLIAGGGEIPDIHLVRSFLSGTKEEMVRISAKKKIDIPHDAFKIVREGMRMAVKEGTASALSGLGIDIAGKTGTAELGSEKKKVNSWFMGFLPYEKPKIAMAIVLEAGSAENLVGSPFAAREFVLWLIDNRPELFGTQNK